MNDHPNLHVILKEAILGFRETPRHRVLRREMLSQMVGSAARAQGATLPKALRLIRHAKRVAKEPSRDDLDEAVAALLATASL